MRTKSAIFAAIERDDARALRKLLVGAPTLIAARDDTHPRRPFAIHAAAACGRTAILRTLLKAGADPDALDGSHTSAIGHAAVYGHVDTVHELLASGANPNIRNDLGITPLTAARAGARGSWRNYSSAASSNRASIVTALEARGAEL